MNIFGFLTNFFDADSNSGPTFNIDGTPMIGSVDIHVHPFGVTDIFESHSFNTTDLFSSTSMFDDGF